MNTCHYSRALSLPRAIFLSALSLFILSAISLQAVVSISVQPAGQQKTIGSSASFTVTASGNGTLHYQWRLNGNNVGTDSSSYSVASVANADLGFYSVVVTDADPSSATSAIATLSVPMTTVAGSEARSEWA